MKFKPQIILIAALIASNASASCDADCLKQKALFGDPQAALMMAEQSIKSNRNDMIYWYRIAAENGSVVGQSNYGVFLVSESKRSDECVRALFWLKKAALAGNAYAKDYIAPLEKGLKAGQFQLGCNGVIK